MGSLFWKLFGAFWLTTIVILTITIVMSFRLADTTAEHFDPWGAQPLQEVLQSTGIRGLRQFVADPANFPPGRSVYIVDRDGRDVVGRELPQPVERRARRAWASIESRLRERPGRAVRTRFPVLETDSGEWLLAIPGPARPPRFGIFSFTHVRWVILGVAALVSLLVFWLLSRSLTRPVARISATARQLARGDLTARVGLGGQDEIGQLATHFDAMAAELESQSKNRRELFRNIAHELRAPLTRLQIATDLLERKPQKTGEQLARIRYEIQRVENLARQVLSLARAEQGAEHDETTALRPVIDRIVQDARFEAGAKSVTVHYQPPVADLPVKGRADALASAIENVVRNAVQMSPAGGEVSIVVQDGDPRTVVVADSGPGVADEELARIFEAFYRVDTNRPGSGIGLAIAQRVVRQVGGVIRACNRPQGGLQVTLELPAEPGT